jgi:hypothetical protein
MLGGGWVKVNGSTGSSYGACAARKRTTQVCSVIKSDSYTYSIPKARDSYAIAIPRLKHSNL